ncbi:hypothetical protein [Butyricimonas sp. Marseille-P3923]|uniref:hypothetical protein n=1 Tax=Butyricimonas sp. Marseille-P3923 TaxID=1987504 RepID=UPI000C0843B0|nr:hypothetical protein [Butyricimonas sp. Marseille-P3923]
MTNIDTNDTDYQYSDIFDLTPEDIEESSTIYTLREEENITSNNDIILSNEEETLYSIESSNNIIIQDTIEKQETPDNILKEQEAIVIECTPTTSHLSERLNETPCGIIECPVPNIGATYLELHTQRNSIILFSTPEEALQHSQVTTSSLCIDSLHGNIKEEIICYKANVEWKKFIISSFTLKTLVFLLKDEIINYFFMIRNMEELQATSNQLNAEVLDYYIKFPPTNRCIYTTDHLAFTHPLLKEEKRHIIHWQQPLHKNVTLYPCVNITGRIKTIIEKLPVQDKVILIYPSVRQSKLCILNLEERYQKECGIICSPNKQLEAGKYHVEQEGETPSSPKRIIFWCFNKLKKEITEKAHLIIVSDTKQWNTLFSLKQIINLTKEETLSNHLVHNTMYYKETWLNEIALMIERGSKIVKLLNVADELSDGDKSLTKLFAIVQNVIKEKVTGRLQGRFSPVSLVRKNIENTWEVAYMNLDYLLLRINLYRNHYKVPKFLETALKSYYDVTSIPDDTNEKPKKQLEIEEEEKKQQKELTQKERVKVLDEILELHNNQQVDEKVLSRKSYHGNSAQRKVYKQVLSLYKYINMEEAIQLLKELKSGNNIGFKNLNNSVVFWALDEEHPLKLSVHETFKVGNKYTNEEIEAKMQPIIYYHLHKDFKEKGRKLITLFRCFFKTTRPKKEYIILKESKFSSHKNRLNKSENDLLQYFMF